MVTRFGKFCRILRINCGEVLRDMALKLGVSSAYLSAIETGKRTMPPKWKDEIIKIYKLSDSEIDELTEAICHDRNEVTFTLDKFSNDDRNRLVAFARRSDDSVEENKALSLKDLFQ